MPRSSRRWRASRSPRHLTVRRVPGTRGSSARWRAANAPRRSGWARIPADPEPSTSPPRQAYGPVQRIEPMGCPRVVTQIAKSTSHPASGETGHSAKLADLYTRTGPASVRLAYLLTGDRAAAEDIAQDAFVRVVGRLGHLRDPGAFDAYLRRAIVNLVKNHHRRKALERRFLARA